MKVSELEGAELDYWVAKAEGKSDALIEEALHAWPYCTQWRLSGPIIEREGIGVEPLQWKDGIVTAWMAHIFRAESTSEGAVGTTLLIAAMRCFVASKFGEEVWVERQMIWTEGNHAAAPTEDDMCPNCLTPWKCNGPHLAWRR